MTYVVTDNCIQCKYTDCVEVCPADAFHEGPNFLAINPELCVDCDLCVAECPAEAIFADDELPAGMEVFRELNKELAEKWPTIRYQQAALPEADAWKGRANKIELLQIEAA